MKAVFYNRDFSHRINPPTDFEIERYSHNMIGGPQRAYMSGELTGDEWDYMKLLRAPVEIWDEGKCLWWGYVNRVTIPAGDEQRLGLGLDELYNHVIVGYTDGDTAAASDTESITEYGQKETRLSNPYATLTEAQQSRDLYLDNHQYARPEIEFSGGSNEVSLECYGWFSSLGWKYYSTTDNANTENTAQITAIIASSGQFLNGSIIENLANLTSNQYRDGTSTALTYVNQLLNAGTSNVRPLIAKVDKERYVHVYERQPEPPTNKPDYLMRGDGKLVTPLNQVIPDKECITAVWVKVRDVPDNLGGFSAMRPFYIDSAEYNVQRDKTTYKAANAYEQIRLSKYIAEVISGNNTGSGGVSGGGSYLPYIPIEQHVHVMPTLHRTGLYIPNIGTGMTAYITISGNPSVYQNTTYAGLNYFQPGATDGSGNISWVCLVSGVYIIELNIEITSGTSIPTAGDWSAQVVKNRSGYNILGYDGGSVPAGGWAGSGTHSIVAKRKFNAGQWLGVRVVNGTDGDLTVSLAEMVVTLERQTGEAST